MTKHTMSAAARRRFVARSTEASARLERREVPADHVRSTKVENFVAALGRVAPLPGDERRDPAPRSGSR